MARSTIFKMLLIFLMVLSWSLTFVQANTGWWQFSHEDARVRVLLSISPLAPDVGENASMIFSITNETDLITSPFLARLNITRDGKQATLGEWKTVQYGVHPENVVFNESGFHEIGLHLEINNRSYFVDFPISVHPRQPPAPSRLPAPGMILLLAALFIGGYGLGKGMRRFWKEPF